MRGGGVTRRVLQTPGPGAQSLSPEHPGLFATPSSGGDAGWDRRVPGQRLRVLSPVGHSCAPCGEEGQEQHSNTLMGLKWGGRLPQDPTISVSGRPRQRTTDWGQQRKTVLSRIWKPEVHGQGAAGLVLSGDSGEDSFLVARGSWGFWLVDTSPVLCL